MLVVLVQADDRCLDAVVRKQLAGAAGVFGGNQVDLTKHASSAKGEVFKVADGGGDDEERPWHIPYNDLLDGAIRCLSTSITVVRAGTDSSASRSFRMPRLTRALPAETGRSRS